MAESVSSRHLSALNNSIFLPIYGNALIHDHCELLVLVWLVILEDREAKFFNPVLNCVVARGLSESITQQLGEDLQDCHYSSQPTWCTHVD